LNKYRINHNFKIYTAPQKRSREKQQALSQNSVPRLDELGSRLRFKGVSRKTVIR